MLAPVHASVPGAARMDPLGGSPLHIKMHVSGCGTPHTARGAQRGTAAAMAGEAGEVGGTGAPRPRWILGRAVVVALVAAAARTRAASAAPADAPAVAPGVVAAAAGVPCSRSRARQARAIASEFVVAPALALGYELPPACALAPSNDVYAVQEAGKRMRRRGQWQCAHCGKLFRTEEHLDKHLGNRHSDLIPEGAHVCLADLCDVLHCDAVEVGAEAMLRAPCRESDMQRARHACEAHAHQCYPAGAPPPLGRAFNERFCALLTCERRHEAASLLRPHGTSAVRVWWWIGLVLAIIANVALLGTLTYRKMQLATRRDLRRVAKGSLLDRVAQAFLGKKKKVY